MRDASIIAAQIVPPLGALSARQTHLPACRSLCTSTYQLNFLEVPSGIKIVLNSSPGAGNLRYLLERFYHELFVALVVKDPTQLPGERIQSAVFEEEVDAFFRKTGFL
jgi:trafficking protein particle complex subunit 1